MHNRSRPPPERARDRPDAAAATATHPHRRRPRYHHPRTTLIVVALLAALVGVWLYAVLAPGGSLQRSRLARGLATRTAETGHAPTAEECAARLTMADADADADADSSSSVVLMLFSAASAEDSGGGGGRNGSGGRALNGPGCDGACDSHEELLQRRFDYVAGAYLTSPHQSGGPPPSPLSRYHGFFSSSRATLWTVDEADDQQERSRHGVTVGGGPIPAGEGLSCGRWCWTWCTPT